MAEQEGAPRRAPRPGARRAAKPKRTFQPQLLLLGLGALAALGAWGALVWAAIDFGRSARGGESGKWVLLAVASVGGVACLFLCLLLITRILRRIGLLEDSGSDPKPGTTGHVTGQVTGHVAGHVERHAKTHAGRHGTTTHRH